VQRKSKAVGIKRGDLWTSGYRAEPSPPPERKRPPCWGLFAPLWHTPGAPSPQMSPPLDLPLRHVKREGGRERERERERESGCGGRGGSGGGAGMRPCLGPALRRDLPLRRDIDKEGERA